MHTIEPYYNWRKYYRAESDQKSPFFGRVYSEFYFTNTVYNYYIHPQWDDFGSETLFLKLLYTDYEKGFTIIEFIGEWNDCLFNDVMFLKRNVIETLVESGINKFILIGENVFNFHFFDSSYYEEWREEIEDGWILAMNFQDHVRKEFIQEGLNDYFIIGGNFNNFSGWRSYKPQKLYGRIVRDLSFTLDSPQ